MYLQGQCGHCKQAARVGDNRVSLLKINISCCMPGF